MNTGRVTEAVTAANAYLAAHADDQSFRLASATSLAEHGDLRAASQILEPAEGRDDATADLLVLASEVHRALTQPQSQGHGATIFHPISAEERAKHLSDARALLRRALHIEPNRHHERLILAWLLANADELQQSLDQLDHLQHANASSVPVHHLRSQVLLGLRRPEEAALALEPALAEEPAAPLLLLTQIEILKALGEADKAAGIKRRLVFDQFVPASFGLAFSSTHADSVEKLSAASGADKEIRRLGKVKTRESAILLSSFLLQHTHDANETLAWRTLDGFPLKIRGDYIAKVFEQAGSTCTIRQATERLATMSHPQAYELLSARLKTDVDWVPSDIAGGLGKLGDPRAVPLLIEVLVGHEETAKQETDGASEAQVTSRVLSGGDINSARARAARALGMLGGPQAKAALAERTSDPVDRVRSSVHAALYRLTRDPKHLSALQPFVGDLVHHEAFEILREVGTPQALNVVRRHDRSLKARDEAESQ